MEFLSGFVALAADGGRGESIAGFLGSVLCIIGLWKVFVKAGEPGWAAIIPFYNLYVLFKITWGSGIKFLLLFIPVANIVFMVMTCVKLARAFGRSGGFAVGLIFLMPIFLLILGFGDSGYIGPNGAFEGYSPVAGGPAQPDGDSWSCDCGTTVQGNFCPNCGKQRPVAPPETRHFCPNCGTVLEEGKRYCPNCGNTVE